MALEVIGTGFGRTGTDSMREALTILGFGPCHHMFEVIQNPEQKARWRAHVAGEPVGWEALFEGYRSCVDWPSAHYWRELVAAYPNAKVLLTWRSAESWWESFDKTIGAGIAKHTDMQALAITLIKSKAFGGRTDDRAHAIAVYEAHVKSVLEEVPPGRLLVHRLGDGWGPLCAFLNVPVPDTPYPSANSADAFKERTKGLLSKS